MTRAKKHRATIGDVSALADVSRATVSRVMNGSPTVDAVIADRVRKAAAELQYRPSNLARSLSLGRTGTVAVSVPDLRNPMLHTVLQGISASAAHDGYHLLVSIAGDDVSQEERHFLDARQRCDGLILVNPRGPEDELRSALLQLSPAVVINRDTTDLPAPTLSVNHERGIALLIEHLKEMGHRHLAYVTGPPTAVSDLPRKRAIARALAADSRLEIQTVSGGRDVFDGREAAEQVLRTRATGVLVFNDLVAVGLLSKLRELGISVPDQLSVAGFDDIDLAHCAYPSLTTVKVAHYELGCRAWRELAVLLEHPDAASEAFHSFDADLVRRCSTGPAPEIPR